MRKIGFKNFKRFENFSPIDIAPVTMLVGANNAGKSTFMQGVLLANENISNLEIPRSYGGKVRFKGFEHPLFTLDLTKHDAGVFTFDRIANKDNSAEEIEFFEEIHFSDFSENEVTYVNSYLSRFTVTIAVQKPSSDFVGDVNYKAQVIRLVVEDRANLLRYRYDFGQKKMFMDVLSTCSEQEQAIYEDFKKELEVLNKLDEEKRVLYKSAELKRLASKGFANKSKEDFCKQNLSLETFISVEMPLTDKVLYRDKDWGVYSHTTIGKYIENILLYLVEARNKKQECIIFKYDVTKFDEETVRAIILARINDIRNSALSLEASTAEQRDIINIHAHHVSRSAYYNVMDKNDFLAKSIHEYIGIANVNKQAAMKEFVLKWMREDKFDIGKDFEITPLPAGELYSVEILKENGTRQYLADLGTGSNQLMTMLLNLARAYVSNNAIVLIEEPEQNLHPNFQSKLMDLFAEVACGSEGDKNHAVTLIIETHSECLIRKSQVLVAELAKEKGYKTQVELEANNPYKVYYFPKEGKPYDMGYNTDGFFEEKFDDGFFDEAGSLYMGLISK